MVTQRPSTTQSIVMIDKRTFDSGLTEQVIAVAVNHVGIAEVVLLFQYLGVGAVGVYQVVGALPCDGAALSDTRWVVGVVCCLTLYIGFYKAVLAVVSVRRVQAAVDIFGQGVAVGIILPGDGVGAGFA